VPRNLRPPERQNSAPKETTVTEIRNAIGRFDNFDGKVHIFKSAEQRQAELNALKFRSAEQRQAELNTLKFRSTEQRQAECNTLKSILTFFVKRSVANDRLSDFLSAYRENIFCDKKRRAHVLRRDAQRQD
jgi:hypothetical protein